MFQRIFKRKSDKTITEPLIQNKVISDPNSVLSLKLPNTLSEPQLAQIQAHIHQNPPPFMATPYQLQQWLTQSQPPLFITQDDCSWCYPLNHTPLQFKQLHERVFSRLIQLMSESATEEHKHLLSRLIEESNLLNSRTWNQEDAIVKLHHVDCHLNNPSHYQWCLQQMLQIKKQGV